MAYVTTEERIVHTEDSSAQLMFRRIAYFVLNVFELALALRLLLLAFGANPAAGFVNFIYNLTEPLVRPFSGIISNARLDSGIIEASTIMAMAVYAVAAALLVQLVSLLAAPPKGGA